MMRALVFAVLDLGFEPRIANARAGSEHQRIDKIVALIAGSRFGIHDLSRAKATAADEYYRLNMPFELGMDVACQRLGSPRFADKVLLILEAEAFDYQKALSDLAGVDTRTHEGRPARLIEHVRSWLAEHLGADLPGPAALWSRFNDYTAWNYDDRTIRGFDGEQIGRMSMSEQLRQMRRWIVDNPVPA